MAIALTTITNSIAALSISGVTILDIDQIPAEGTRAGLPVLYPEPGGFITNFVMVRDSFGGGSSAKMTLEYDLTYTFLHTVMGSDRAMAPYDDMVDKAMEILDAIIALDELTGVIDIVPNSPLEFGKAADPSGNMFFGCKFVFHIKEFGPNG